MKEIEQAKQLFLEVERGFLPKDYQERILVRIAEKLHQTRLEALEEYKRDNLLLNEIRNEQFNLGFNHGLEEAAKVAEDFHKHIVAPPESVAEIAGRYERMGTKVAAKIRTLAKKEEGKK